MRAQSMKMKRREPTAQSSDSAEVIEKLKDHERGRIKRDEEDSGSIMTVHTGIKGHKHLTSSDCRSVGGSLYTQVTPSFMFQRTHTHTTTTFNSPWFTVWAYDTHTHHWTSQNPVPPEVELLKALLQKILVSDWLDVTGYSHESSWWKSNHDILPQNHDHESHSHLFDLF